MALVAPFAGAWIEIKYVIGYFSRHIVAPFAGAWIEMLNGVPISSAVVVAPFAGAWIEMTEAALPEDTPESLPSRERGLKFIKSLLCAVGHCRRSLRGSVD